VSQRQYKGSGAVESGVESKMDEASGCLLLVGASAQVPFSALKLPVSDRKSIWPVENLLCLSPNFSVREHMD